MGIKLLGLVRRSGLLIALTTLLAVGLLGSASWYLNQAEPAVTGPSVVAGGKETPLPSTTKRCSNDPDLCPAILIDAGTTLSVKGVTGALGLSMSDGTALQPARWENDAWTVEVPPTTGTMLITSGEQVWSIRISCPLPVRTGAIVRRIVTGFTTVIFLLCSLISAQAAEQPITARPDGYGNGYNNVVGDKGAFQRIFRVGDSKISVYSLDLRRSVGMEANTVYSATTRGGSRIKQIDRAADIAVRSGRIGTPLENTNAEAAAVQVAIWMLTNDLDPTPVGAINAPIKARAEALVAASAATNELQADLGVRMTGRVNGSGERRRLEVTIFSGGKPAAGSLVTLEMGTTALELRTNDDGVAIATLASLRSASPYKATFRWRLPAGTVLAPADGAPVVTTAEAEGSAILKGNIPMASSTQGPSSKPIATPKSSSSPTGEPSQTPKPKQTIKPSKSPSPSATPTESATAEPADEDPAALVIEFTDGDESPSSPEKPEAPNTTGSESGSSLPALAGAAALLALAIAVARHRSRT